MIRAVRLHASFAYLFVAVTAFGAFGARDAIAEESPRFFLPHAYIAGSHAASNPQGREFGFGLVGSLGGEFAVARIFSRAVRLGFEPRVTGLVLAQGAAPVDPTIRRPDTGAALGLSLGPRITHRSGLFLSGGGGAVFTGGLTRVLLHGALGFDLHAVKGFDFGPYAEYLHVIQPDETLRPADARIVSLGLHGTLGDASQAPPPRVDTDHDGAYDDEDACPTVAGIRTSDPATDGCPPPREVTACPDFSVEKSPGKCLPSDLDQDGLVDTVDACPDVPGPKTASPASSGCPRFDRDNDAIFDDEDACPDNPGVQTSESETNGCPASEGSVRIVGDRILLDETIHFDLDSPRVRHVSWPLVQRVAQLIVANPDIQEVTIEGHADAVGTERHNLMLSRDRAEAVRRLLIHFGVAPDHIKAEAFGQSRLKEQTAGASVRNRRVEFFITQSAGRNGR